MANQAKTPRWGYYAVATILGIVALLALALSMQPDYARTTIASLDDFASGGIDQRVASMRAAGAFDDISSPRLKRLGDLGQRIADVSSKTQAPIPAPRTKNTDTSQDAGKCTLVRVNVPAITQPAMFDLRLWDKTAGLVQAISVCNPTIEVVQPEDGSDKSAFVPVTQGQDGWSYFYVPAARTGTTIITVNLMGEFQGSQRYWVSGTGAGLPIGMVESFPDIKLVPSDKVWGKTN